MKQKTKSFERRRAHVRRVLAGRSNNRPRLVVFRSHKHIYAQIINDDESHTVAAASSLEKDFREQSKGGDCDAARKIGEILAQRAKEAGVVETVFDRGGYRYHGRVKALAEGARAGGLQF